MSWIFSGRSLKLIKVRFARDACLARILSPLTLHKELLVFSNALNVSTESNPHYITRPATNIFTFPSFDCEVKSTSGTGFIRDSSTLPKSKY